MLAGSSAAEAYVRARTSDTGRPYFWHDPREILELATPPDGIGISASEFRDAATHAVAAWSQPAIPCTVATLQLADSMVANEEAKRDGHNRIIMRTGAWCRDPIQMTHCDDRDMSQLAVTTLFTRSHPGLPDDGQILEADIEVNTIDNTFAIIPDGPVNARDYLNDVDLASVLTHEAGHFIGLAHNCRGPNDPLLLDDAGVLSPECSSSEAQDATIRGATMYPIINPVDVHARTLTADEVRAACEIYPLGSLPNDDWTGALTCSAGAGDAHLGDPRRLLEVAMVLGAIWLSRRPRGARSSR
jgi:hypothetical protein